MSAFFKKKSPAERLHGDGWWSILQFLDGNDIARVLGVSVALHALYGAAGIWTNAINTITLPQTHLSDAEVEKWRLQAKTIELDSRHLDEKSDNSSFHSAIKAIAANCPKLQSLVLLQVPITLANIGSLSDALQARAQSGIPLKKLVLELNWLGDKASWSCARALADRLVELLPEEVEFRWVRLSASSMEMHYHYRDAVFDLINYNVSALKFTLPGSLWAEPYGDGEMYKALAENKTMQSLTFSVPYVVMVSEWEHIDRPGGLIGCFSRILVHPSLRHLNIADRVAPASGGSFNRSYCTALFFSDPEDFPKSSLETLHLELGSENVGGLLAVLNDVVKMPQLKRFTISWPAGGHPAPQQIPIQHLQQFLRDGSRVPQHYNKRSSWSSSSLEFYNPLSWATLSTLFV
jgi:hypothetical protein